MGRVRSSGIRVSAGHVLGVLPMTPGVASCKPSKMIPQPTGTPHAPRSRIQNDREFFFSIDDRMATRLRSRHRHGRWIFLRRKLSSSFEDRRFEEKSRSVRRPRFVSDDIRMIRSHNGSMMTSASASLLHNGEHYVERARIHDDPVRRL